jgi:hypothetical protein
MLVATSWRAVRDDYRGAEQPEVALRLVHPESPMIALDNKSGTVARDIKWMVAIWNADDLRVYVPGSAGNDPLPIPISTFDFLRPHASSGFQAVFQQSVNAGYIKPGNHLIGSISVICPTCIRGYTYFVFIEWGKGGWYSDVPAATEGELIVPKPVTKESLEAYFEAIKAIPDALRRQIEAVK